MDETTDTRNAGTSADAGMQMAPGTSTGVTRPQILAVTLLTLLALGAGVLLAALFGNFSMRAADMASGAPATTASGGMPGMDMGAGSGQDPPAIAVLPQMQMSGLAQMNGMVMPPGMIMMPGMSMEAMRGMAAVDPAQIGYSAPADARGDQPLAPRMEGDASVFDLDVALIGWNILPNTQVAAYAFNRQVPGPRISVTQGDKVRINVKNSLPEPTSVHWHGLILPNDMDGAADVTQAPIPPGGSFSYEFVAGQAGTFFYHSHQEPDRQQALGLYGALIIAPAAPPAAAAYERELAIQLQEWTVRGGYTFPAMPMEGLLPNFFTINGKAYPATETVNLKVGERLLVRFIGTSSAFIHPMHIHGGPFKIVATDGNPVPEGAQLQKDTVNVGPGERYDVIWQARSPGKWLIHCHINHHITNDGVEEQGGGGLTMVINVAP